MTRFSIKNWSDFQHYKDRSPPWIKLHKSLLDDFEYQRLPIASKALAPMLWLLASENIEGSFDADPERIAFRIRWSIQDIINGMKPLIQQGFIIVSSGTLAACYQAALPETETETYRAETKTEGEGSQTPAPTVDNSVSPSAQPTRSNGTRLSEEWTLPKKWGEWALNERPELTAEDVRREGNKFADHWHSKPGKDGRKVDWEATWRNWIRSDFVKPSDPSSGKKKGPWYISASGIEAKAAELGVVKKEEEAWPYFRDRVLNKAGINAEMLRKAQQDFGG